MKMLIRDGFAHIQKSDEVHEMPSGSLEIVTPDGRVLFGINLCADGSIEVRAGNVMKLGRQLLDTQLKVLPKVSNSLVIAREIYQR